MTLLTALLTSYHSFCLRIISGEKQCAMLDNIPYTFLKDNDFTYSSTKYPVSIYWEFISIFHYYGRNSLHINIIHPSIGKIHIIKMNMEKFKKNFDSDSILRLYARSTTLTSPTAITILDRSFNTASRLLTRGHHDDRSTCTAQITGEHPQAHSQPPQSVQMLTWRTTEESGL